METYLDKMDRRNPPDRPFRSLVHFWITSLNRPKTCKKTIRHLLDLHVGARITVADDSPDPDVLRGIVDAFPDNVDGVYFDFDAGVSKKRNRALKHTDAPYIVFMDDDNLVGPETRFDHMFALLEFFPRLAVVGQRKNDPGRNRWSNSESRFRLATSREGMALKTIRPPERPTIYRRDWGHSDNTPIPFFYVDFVPLCCMVRRDVLEIVDWDERYKTCGEHIDFFLRLAAANGKKKIIDYLEGRIRAETDPDRAPKFPEMINEGRLLVAFLPGSHFVDTAERNEEYKALRKRGSSFRRHMKNRWGFSGVHTWNTAITYKYDYGI